MKAEKLKRAHVFIQSNCRGKVNESILRKYFNQFCSADLLILFVFFRLHIVLSDNLIIINLINYLLRPASPKLFFQIVGMSLPSPFSVICLYLNGARVSFSVLKRKTNKFEHFNNCPPVSDRRHERFAEI